MSNYTLFLAMIAALLPGGGCTWCTYEVTTTDPGTAGSGGTASTPDDEREHEPAMCTADDLVAAQSEDHACHGVFIDCRAVAECLIWTSCLDFASEEVCVDYALGDVEGRPGAGSEFAELVGCVCDRDPSRI